MGSNRARLKELLVTHFSLDELEDIRFGLGIPDGEIVGDTKNARTRELIEYVERHDLMSELLQVCKHERPDISWSVEDKGAIPTVIRETQIMDADLLARRRIAYEALYRILKPFARYDVPEKITVTALGDVSVAMRDWYFDVGGLYLSDHCREPYFDLKERLKQIMEESENPHREDISAENYLGVLDMTSKLRAYLREDILPT
jgi:hypothetical protein